MACEKFLFDLSSVIEKELAAISKRRDAYQSGERADGENKGGPVADLRGLALSGGGIRSASLSLGLVQAFDALGLMRVFDYLSTVSGGGYLGGYLSSSAALRAMRAKDTKVVIGTDEPLYPDLKEIKLAKLDRQAGQPDRVRRFIFGGKYLHKPWQLANKYLIGLFFNSVAILSGLAFVCCLVALALRCLDFNWVRDLADIFGLDFDTDMAFLPFVVLLIAWLAAWIASYSRRQADAPGWIAQLLLYFTAAAFLFGCTLILVNGETSLNYVAQAIFDKTKIAHDSTIKSLLLAIVVAGLIPFLNPRVLAQRGLHPRGLLDRCLFRASCVSLLVGVPLVGVGYFGMQNISRTAGSPDNKFSAGDIYDWGAFCKLLVSSTSDDLRAIQTPPAYKDQQQLTQMLANVQQLLDMRERVWKLQKLRDDEWPWIGSSAFRWWSARRELGALQAAVCDDVNQVVLTSPAVAVGLAENQGLLVAIAQSKRDGQNANPPQMALARVKKMVDANRNDSTMGVSHDRSDAALEGIRQAMAYPFHDDDDEWRAFNQNVLVAARPDCFRDLDKVHRAVITVPDQVVRLKWLAVLAAGFLVGLSIDLNATSLHRFYRNRLAFAYLERPKDQKQDLKLSQLNTTAAGAPYHLINASLNRFDSRFGHLLEEFENERADGEPDRRSTRSFLFSNLCCGSEATNFVSTDKYEQLTPPGFAIADAVAISGAAIDPQQFDFAPLAWMMTGLNMRLGQWLPNPAVHDEKRLQACSTRLLTMLRDIPREVEKRRLCFISDGGFNENLGIIPLLKRRCKLIVALDAGCDPRELFQDLGRAIRMARVRDGITIVALPTDDGDKAKSSEFGANMVRKNAEGVSREHFVVGVIKYPRIDGKGPEEGLLVYVKPSFNGDEGADLFAFQAQDCEFPHDTTADQLFDEAHVEAYRQLGYHIGKDIYAKLFAGAVNGADVDLAKVLAAAKKISCPEPPNSSQSLEKIADALNSFAAQRREQSDNDHLMASAGIRAVQRLATMSGHLVDKDGHFADNQEAILQFGHLSDETRRLATRLERTGATDEQLQVAEGLKRLAQVWQSVAIRLAPPLPPAAAPHQNNASQADPAPAKV